MPIANYGVFKGRPISRRLGSGSSPHYQVEVVDDNGEHYRVAVNVLSQTSPSEVMFYTKPFFVHPITTIVGALSTGFHALSPGPNSGALDFIRGNLLQPGLMTPLPISATGADNDLNDKLDGLVQRAMSDENSFLYAFGQRWGPENKADQYFGFKPGNGIHDIHMPPPEADRPVLDQLKEAYEQNSEIIRRGLQLELQRSKSETFVERRKTARK